MDLEEYKKSRQAKADALDMSFINSMIKNMGESWVAQAIENAVDVKLGRAIIVLPKFDIYDRVYYTANDYDDYGTVKNIKIVDNVIKYEVVWDDGEPTDLYTEDQITKVKS